jgi:hypothetical protein
LRRSRKTWGERLDAFRQRTPAIAFLLFAAVIVSALITLGTAAVSVTKWVRSEVFWKRDEYGKLTELRAGVQIRNFEEALGTPLLRRAFAKERFIESIFRGRDYWVQAVTDRDGTTLLYSVTSCDENFSPAFEYPSANSDGDIVPHRVILQKTHFSEVGASGEMHFHWPGSTLNIEYRERTGGGEPWGNRFFYVGLNDLCPPTPREVIDGADIELPERKPAEFGWDLVAGEPRADIFFREFRRASVVNTFGETYDAWSLAPYDSRLPLDKPALEPREIPIQLGVDRLSVRHLVRLLPDNARTPRW